MHWLLFTVLSKLILMFTSYSDQTGVELLWMHKVPFKLSNTKHEQLPVSWHLVLRLSKLFSLIFSSLNCSKLKNPNLFNNLSDIFSIYCTLNTDKKSKPKASRLRRTWSFLKLRGNKSIVLFKHLANKPE